jgi:hypothetical protein
VLDAGISSYGTAREMELLKQLDRSRLKYLMIQYYWNDDGENAAYVRNQGRLSPMAEGELSRRRREFEKSRRYYVGRHMGGVGRLLLKSLEHRLGEFLGDIQNGSTEVLPVSTDSAALFLETIRASQVDLSDVRVFVFTLGRLRERAREFTVSLKAALDSGRYPECRNFCVYDFDRELTPDMYSSLDGHMNREGHKVVASAWLKWWAERR